MAVCVPQRLRAPCGDTVGSDPPLDTQAQPVRQAQLCKHVCVCREACDGPQAPGRTRVALPTGAGTAPSGWGAGGL